VSSTTLGSLAVALCNPQSYSSIHYTSCSPASQSTLGSLEEAFTGTGPQYRLSAGGQDRSRLLSFTTILPLFLMTLLTVLFSAGLPTELPVAVLDRNGTNLSRAVIRMVDATSKIAIIEQVSDLAEGRRLTLSGQVYGLLPPLDLERNACAGRRPEDAALRSHLSEGGHHLKNIPTSPGTPPGKSMIWARSL
jgi:ABC-2 family transporter protein